MFVAIMTKAEFEKLRDYMPLFPKRIFQKPKSEIISLLTSRTMNPEYCSPLVVTSKSFVYVLTTAKRKLRNFPVDSSFIFYFW